MKRYLMVDICAGLGGASEPFVQNPHWTVIRIDISPLVSHVPHMFLKDILEEDFIDWLWAIIREEGFEEFDKIDLLWISPPCTEFSVANPFNNLPDHVPSMELVERSLELIEALKPDAWIIENVRGAIKWFRPLMGDPNTILGSFCLWGDFPLFHVNMKGHSKYFKDPWSDDPLRPFKRAYVPFKIGEALRQSVQYQSRLEKWIAFNHAATNKGKLRSRRRSRSIQSDQDRS